MHSPANLRSLTALRFFAAMWVVLYHYWPNLNPAVMPAVVEKGYLGVELFFILSGFILSHVYLASVADGGFRYGDFLRARLARIYPLHLATLVGVGAMGLAAEAAGRTIDSNVLSWASLPANLLLVQAWGFAPVAGWNHPSWSISAEWFAYLSFPAFAWAALKLRERPRLAVALALAGVASVYPAFERLTGQSLTRATIAWGALRIAPCFAYGCALYLVWRASPARRTGLAICGAALSGAAILFFAQLGAPDPILVALLGVLILSVALLSKGARPLFVSRYLVHLGEISYSIYMICIPWKLLFVNLYAWVFSTGNDTLPLFAWIIFCLALIPLADLSHRLIETPARVFLRRRLAPRHQMLTTVA